MQEKEREKWREFPWHARVFASLLLSPDPAGVIPPYQFSEACLCVSYRRKEVEEKYGSERKLREKHEKSSGKKEKESFSRTGQKRRKRMKKERKELVELGPQRFVNQNERKRRTPFG